MKGIAKFNIFCHLHAILNWEIENQYHTAAFSDKLQHSDMAVNKDYK